MTILRSGALGRASTRILCALVLCALVACSDDSSSDGSSSPDDVSLEIGKKGGTLKSKGVTVVIPEDALDEPVMITIKNKGYAAPSGLKVKQVSDVHEFGPAGTKFKKEVEVKFHTDKDDDKAAVYFTKENSAEFEQISSEKQPGEAGKGPDFVAKTKHFSEGFVGVPLGDTVDAGTGGPDGGGELDGGSWPDAAVGPDGALPSKHIIVHSKDAFGVAVNQTWAAYQDGDGAWKALAPTAVTGTYEFDITGARYGVAFVCAEIQSTDSQGTLHYAPADKSTLEVTTLGPACTLGVAPANHSVSGIAAIGAATYLRFGHETLSSGISATGNVSYSVSPVVHGVTTDILFGRSVSTDTPLLSVLFARDLTLTADLANFNVLVEKNGSPVSSANAAVLNASPNTYLQVLYTTRGAHDGMSLAQGAVTGSSVLVLPFATLPEAIRRPDDRYLLIADESDSAGWRKATLASYPSADLGINMPAAFVATFSAVQTPTWRPIYTFEDRPGTRSYELTLDFAPVRSDNHSFDTTIDPGWLEAGAQHTVTFPDLSGVQGFSSTWMPSSPTAAFALGCSAASVSVAETAAGTLNTEVGARGSF